MDSRVASGRPTGGFGGASRERNQSADRFKPFFQRFSKRRCRLYNAGRSGVTCTAMINQ